MEQMQTEALIRITFLVLALDPARGRRDRPGQSHNVRLQQFDDSALVGLLARDPAQVFDKFRDILGAHIALPQLCRRPTPTRNRSDRPIALDRKPVSVSDLGVIIEHGVVLSTAVVPKRDRVLPPVETAMILWLANMLCVLESEFMNSTNRVMCVRLTSAVPRCD